MGQDIYFPFEKLLDFLTDGAPAMLGVWSGFHTTIRITYHCVIHQQTLAF